MTSLPYTAVNAHPHCTKKRPSALVRASPPWKHCSPPLIAPCAPRPPPHAHSLPGLSQQYTAELLVSYQTGLETAASRGYGEGRHTLKRVRACVLAAVNLLHTQEYTSHKHIVITGPRPLPAPPRQCRSAPRQGCPQRIVWAAGRQAGRETSCPSYQAGNHHSCCKARRELYHSNTPCHGLFV